MSITEGLTETPRLAGLRVAIVGRLAGMSKRDAQQLIKQHGGHCAESADPSGGLIVVGDDVSLAADPAAAPLFNDATQSAIEAGTVEVVSENKFWQRLGLVDDEEHVRRLYTPAMLAQLVGVPVAVVRRWHRRGLIRPVREVSRLPYFDFQEVATARQLAELLAAGISPAAIERKLRELARFVPGAQRPLAQLSIIVRGSRLLLRQGDGLVGPGGQLFFDFDAAKHDGHTSTEPSVLHRPTISFAEA